MGTNNLFYINEQLANRCLIAVEVHYMNFTLLSGLGLTNKGIFAYKIVLSEMGNACLKTFRFFIFKFIWWQILSYQIQLISLNIQLTLPLCFLLRWRKLHSYPSVAFIKSVSICAYVPRTLTTPVSSTLDITPVDIMLTATNVKQDNPPSTGDLECDLGRRMTKPTKWHVLPCDDSDQPGHHPVWSESSLCAQ